MGSNAKTAHAAHTVAPTLGGAPPHPPSEPPAEPPPDPQAQQALELAKVIANGGGNPDDPHGPPLVDLDPDDPVAAYAAFCEQIGQVQEHAGPDDPILADAAEITTSYLAGLTDEQLQQIAAANGFTHPEHATAGELAAWLNPMTPTDAPHKQAIQAHAEHKHAAAAGAPEGSWTATAAEFEAARAAVTAQLAAYADATDVQARAELLAEAIAAENRLSAASCPELGDAETEAAKTGIRDKVDAAIDDASPEVLASVVAWGQAEGLITTEQAEVLSPQQAVTLTRENLIDGYHKYLTQCADARLDQLNQLNTVHGELVKLLDGGLAPLNGSQPEIAMAKAAALTAVAGKAMGLKTKVQHWSGEVPALSGPDAPPALDPASALDPGQLTGQFTAWAQDQSLADLRKTAEIAGLQHAATAPKAQLTKWFAAHWDSTYNKSGIENDLAIKAKLAPAPGAPPAAPAAGAAGKPAPPPVAKSPDGFIAKHLGLIQALRHAQGTVADLPQRHDPAEVASWSFGKGEKAQMGGMHTKTVHQAPDGSAWLFKPDKQAGGARAHAEAAASQIFQAAGVPSVPVYVKQIGGAPGAIQPLIKNAVHLPTKPAFWTQADVDAIVRYHVAAWAVGDHDGKNDNILRTPSGGLVPIDQGQAFKFYGSDKLALGYHPNASFGADRPVFQQAYEAHQKGGLGKDVKINPAAAHPVIKRFEKIPDSQWRAMLNSSAYEGAKSGQAAWISAMRDRAAGKHGIPANKVTTDQVAEAFLDHACERKNNLRAAFADFFTDQLGLASGQALKHG